MTAALLILALAFAQNVTFSIVSRSRNRDHARYHVGASLLSNITWFLTFKQLLVSELSWAILPFYVLGTTDWLGDRAPIRDAHRASAVREVRLARGGAALKCGFCPASLEGGALASTALSDSFCSLCLLRRCLGDEGRDGSAGSRVAGRGLELGRTRSRRQ